MNTKLILRRTGTALVTMGLLASTQMALAAAGKVLFVSGSVNLERNGTRALQVNDPLNVGDTVATGDRSRAQLLMADGARIALRAGTRFRVDELALPTNVQQPGMAVAVAASGKSVTTLLKGGFSTRDGAIAKSTPSAYEMRTPIGTLGIRGTFYSAVLCRGDCADAPGLPPGQPIADGLYIAVDEGTITFNGRGLALTLTAPAYTFIPLETGDPQPLANPPAFLRNDGAGPLQLAGRAVRIAAVNDARLADVNDRRSPTEGTVQTSGEASQTEEQTEGKSPEQRITAQSALGSDVELTDPQIPQLQQASVAAAVPAAGQQAGFTTSATGLSETYVFNGTSLVQFDAQFGGATGTYLSGTATLLEAGSNAASGIRWGRWSGGTASANTAGGIQQLNLANSSLHWIVGPNFEFTPVLPVAGVVNFTLAAGTNPTDDGARVGVLGGAVLAADFTAQTVATTLSVDINGLNWLASGTGAITAGTVRFGGAFNSVLIDGRVPGTGSFAGFFSSDPATPSTINGVGLSYRIVDSLNQLGTVSGVAAFVPGTGQAPIPPVVSRDVAYAVGTFDGSSFGGASATNTVVQIGLDANGDLTAFFVPLARGATGSLQIGTATIANTGADAATGIRWGRWQAGVVDIVVPPVTGQSDISGEALHWLVDTGFGAAPALPQTGTAAYTVVGNTDPTDTLANVGTLGAASFSADFTNRTVASALSLTMGGFNWYASGTGTFTQGSRLFSGTYGTVSVENLVTGNGNFSGYFTVPRLGGGTIAGAGLAYNLTTNPNDLGLVSGAIAFAQGQGNPLTPAAQQQRDISLLVPVNGVDFAVVQTAPANSYGVDAGFNLTQFTATAIPADPPQVGVFTIGTSSLVESDVSALTMLRWGRWSGGNAAYTDVGSGATGTIDLTQASLHWIEGADGAAPPIMPVSGTVSYSLIGATVPTDRLGNVGVLNSATFDANFTTQQVATSVDLTVNNLNWVASGIGSIGGQANLPAHQFAGSFNGIINPIQGTVSGTFSGFFTTPGSNVPGIPGGVGLTYSLQDGFMQVSPVDGAIAFKAP